MAIQTIVFYIIIFIIGLFTGAEFPEQISKLRQGLINLTKKGGKK